MDHWIKIMAVQHMQDYIKRHAADGPFRFADLYAAAGYSRRHADRIFRELTGKTPRDYLRAVQLTESAEKLLDERKSVLEVALETSFDSHEGYTKAFSGAFGVTPSAYRRTVPTIPLFIQYPVRDYYSHLEQKEDPVMDNKSTLCMITPISRPARRLLFLRSKHATDYWTYCQEMSCAWDGLLGSIPSKFDTAAILEMPEFLQKPGFSAVAAGVELPADYSGAIPEGYELADLPPCDMLYFQSAPYEQEEDYAKAIGVVFEAVAPYDPGSFGYAFAPELAPSFNFGAEAKTGARQAYPVRRIK